MYGLSVNGVRIPSQEIARMCVENKGDTPETMQHLGSIERIEARGITYSNQDFDVLNSAYTYATT